MPSKSKPESLGGRIKQSAVKPPHQEPVWAGPEDGGPTGGVTQSMLSDFIMCRERFRLRVVEGLDLAPAFNHRLEYGQMWHTCEEALAGYNSRTGTQLLSQTVESALKAYCKSLCEKYRTSQEQVVHWMNVCNTQFPIYLNYWREHQDVKDRTPLLQEQAFHVPYKLPSGRTVYLRGKWDSVDLIGKGKSAGVYLQENKTKGDIKEEQLKRQLQSGFDLQTMFYLTALVREEDWAGVLGRDQGGTAKLLDSAIVKGVRYNVVRRPLSGGKHSIKQKQGQTPEEFYAELGERIASEPEYFFMRWRVEISRADIERFRHECLDPLLDQLCLWWDHISGTSSRESPFDCRPGGPDYMVHWRTPYGLYNILAEGGSADVDEYMNTGSDVGLVRGQPLFGELKDA